MAEESARESRNASRPTFENKLSKCSRAFDVDNKGYLSPAQQRMRSLDSQGKGFLTNEQVRNRVLLLFYSTGSQRY